MIRKSILLVVSLTGIVMADTGVVPVKVIGTVTTTGGSSSGISTVTFNGSPQPVSQAGTYTVTPGTGTWAISGSVSSTPGPIQIWGVGGSTLTVGYATGGSSVPVNVLNTVPVTGTFFQATQPISGAVSQAGSYSVTPGSGTFPISGTVTTTQSVDSSLNASVSIKGSSNTVSAAQSGTWTVQPGNTANTTAWKVDGSAVTQPVSVATPFTVSLTTSTVNGSTVAVVNANGTTLGISAIPTGTNNIGTVTGSTITVSPQGGIMADNISQIGGTTVLTGGTNGSLGIGGLSAQGAAASGNPIPEGVTVSSTTIPTAQADGNMIRVGGSNIGQVMVTGLPGGLVKYSTATLTTVTSEQIFISSAGAATYTYLCGCVITNTSATNASVTFRQSGPSTNNTNQILIGAPANFIPAGIWPGCANPFFRSTANSNITIQGSASVTSLEVRCQYYTGP